MPLSLGSRKQLLLYLGAVVVPGVMVATFAMQTAKRERALASQAEVEARRQAARQIAGQLSVSLVDMRVRAAADEDVTDRDAPGLVTLIRIREDSQARRVSRPAAASTAAIRAAERAEFSGDRGRAVALYQQLLGSSDVPARAYAQLGLARTLAASGRPDQAAEHYMSMLALSPEVTDDDGIPIGLYAADRLKDQPMHADTIARILWSRLSSSSLLMPLEAYMMRDVAIALDLEWRDSLVALAREQVARAERMAALRRDLSALMRLHGGSRGATSSRETAWFPFGDPLWLVSARSERPGDTSVVVVDASQLGRMVSSQLPGLTVGPVRLFRESEGAEGESLAPQLPGLRAAFDLPPLPMSRGAALAAPIMAFVLLMAIFAAYLLWRDVRRESRVAAQRARFASAVSHELKTPLTSIRMYAELIRMYPADPLRRHDYLDTIMGESERLTRLIDNVLHFSRMDRGSQRYHLEEGRIQDVVHAAAGAMEYPMAREGLRLQLGVDETVPPARIDRDAMTNAVLNLLSNAVKFSPAGGDVELRLERSNGHAVISVRDEGVGIPDDVQGRVFEEFYRSPDADERGIAGTGLGLALVNDVVRAHGGSVTLTSAPGSGSTFAIRLPLEDGR